MKHLNKTKSFPRILFQAILFIGLFIIPFQGNSQSTPLDSLAQELAKANDMDRIPILFELVEILKYNDPSEALIYADEALGIALAFEAKKEQVIAYYHKGGLLCTTGEFQESLTTFKKGYPLAKQVSNPDKTSNYLMQLGRLSRVLGEMDLALAYVNEGIERSKEVGDKKTLVNLYNGLADIKIAQGEFDEALKAAFKGLTIAKQLSHPGYTAIVVGSIGQIYWDLKNYEEALKWLKKSAEINKETGNQNNLRIDYLDIGKCMTSIGRLDSAMYYYQESYLISESFSDSVVMGSILYKIGMLHFQMKDFDKALEKVSEAHDIAQRFNAKFSLISCKINLSTIYAEKDLRLSLKYAKEALPLAEELKDLGSLSTIHQNLGEIYYKLEDYQSAFEHQLKHDELSDSIYISKTEEQLQVRLDYENKQKELEKTAINQANQLNIYERNLLIGIVIVLLLISFLLIILQRLNIRKKESLLAKEKEVDQLKSRFFANISHEFRTPLTLILGPVVDLYKKAASSADKAALGLIRNNAQRLLRLVNQILDLSKLESGKFSLKLIESDPVAFARRITASFQSMVQSNSINLDFDSQISQQDIPFDPDILEKIVVNLVANAIKYTSAGGSITISIWEENTKENKDGVYFQVADTGIGISAEHLPHIFDRFYQAQTDDYTTHQPSTGIGLALVKELIELHKGEISVDSIPKEGTTFTFWIPKEKTAYQPEDFVSNSTIDELEKDSIITSPHNFHTTSTGIASDSERASVLIIEDNPDVRTYLKKCLINSYQVIEAIDGKEGVETAIKEIPDLIITDVMMPHKDGFAVTQELKQNPLTHHIPIIILTGKSSRESRLEGLEKEADDFLTKPFDEEELSLRIQGLLANRKRLQAKFSRRLLLEVSEVEVSSQEEIFITQAISVVEANLSNEDFTIEQMAAALHINRVQLFRKLKSLTDQSPSRFIRSIRLKRAKQLIEGRTGTISEVAYSVGFSSPTYFGKCFKEQFGSAPGDWLLKEDL